MSATVHRLVAESCGRFPGLPALAYKRDAVYERLTFDALGASVRKFAAGLAALGVRHGDCLGIVSENRPEWVIADLGILTLGAVSVPIFTALPPAQIEQLVRDSGARWLIVSDETQSKKAGLVQASISGLRVVTMDCASEPERGIFSFADVMRRGGDQPISDADFEALGRAVGPDDLASIVYTSGTTGEPKGVMLTHRNFVSNIEGCCAAFSFGPGDVVLSFLPLSHCLERVGSYYAPLAAGSMVAYAQSLRRLRENIREVEPTFMILVPRVCEAFEEGIRDRVARAPNGQRRLFAWALGAGEARTRRQQRGERLPPLVAFRAWLADRLVCARLCTAMGFRRRRFLVCGGAPLSSATATFLHAIGLPVLEGYGLTEAAPVITVNRVDRWRIGTVGYPLHNVEVRIAGNGEVLCRGANVMRGYHGRPDDTAQAIDEDGWLHTGDLGVIDGDGFLSITGRIKELLVLSNGKKVVPQPIEMRLCSSAYIAQAVLVGDGKPTVGALIVPNFDHLAAWARAQGTALPKNPAAVCAMPEIEALIRREAARLCAGLADYEQVRIISLFGAPFTVEGGELTPTLKVRRRVVLERYADRIEAMFPRG
jgi:long-chain acyl-CoA synthetase